MTNKKMSLHKALGLTKGLLHIKDMDDFLEEGLVSGLEEIEAILSEYLEESENE